ncbi:uncharacterized protein BJ171DRAFT_278041 [Polychytrium aggregatum]|uniref:uncharacterized protein n=1 Tax=Polychytrium aggregatum TaxID=110093 RepID=UPI0022FE50BF|nr:uncharacterized protein BJ171DRAFT_278041 [Polychytrium aggregatum]KAI9207593.1 hypothetical protein BJ171DRAFT_278041 [Polychytrium aggregatum]
MGALISYLRGGEGAADHAAISGSNILIDLDGAQPLQSEIDIYNYLSNILAPASYHLDVMSHYNGCGDYIRRAISTPNRETEEAAWKAVCPAVSNLKDCYEFSQRLEDAFPRALHFFCQGDIGRNLESHQATAKRLADMLHFASKFDEIKMNNPNIQNDFSFYRRTLSRMRMSNTQRAVIVNEDLANRMSLFYAHATPMTKSLIDSTQVALSRRNFSEEALTDCLSILCAICYNIVSKNAGANQPLTDFCLRVIVVSVVLYDNVTQAGAFSKGSKLNIRSTVRLIQQFGGAHANSLMNALRYTTVHLNDEATPKGIKQLFA